jgi:hypothetical protein
MQSRSQTSFSISGDNVAIDVATDDDFVIVKKPEIIKIKCPVMNDNNYFSWRFECTRAGSTLRISAVSEISELEEMQKIELFKMRTLFGAPKISFSSRNAFKYSIPISSWHIEPNNRGCFRTPTLVIQGQLVVYEIYIMKYNCENTPKGLFPLLNKHYEHMYGARDDLGFIEPISPRISAYLERANYYNSRFILDLFRE